MISMQSPSRSSVSRAWPRPWVIAAWLMALILLAGGWVAVRAGDDKGRHTTVTRELIPIDGGGVLIDTPGLRGIGLHDADDGIGQVYADIEALAAQCRFDDCEHHSEPGCAVQEAIANGTVDAGRLGRYEKMLRESRWAAARGNAREERRQRETWKAITRQQRGAYRFRENNGLR